MHPSSIDASFRTWLLAGTYAIGAIVTALAYWVGLAGPFMLDDPENFVQLARYAAGEVTALGPIVSNGSGPLGRPLSMASFVASVWAGGFDPWVIKVGNLALHVSTGALVTLFAFLVLRRDPRLAARADLLAVLVGLVWLAMPLHVSTVLYAVQRMSQLSALLMLVGLIGYVLLRERLDRAGTSTPAATLGLGVWLLVMTAVSGHAKENGLLLPVLCGVVELTMFPQRTGARRGAWLLLGTGALLAIAAASIVLWSRPELLLSGYTIRPFTLVERLLTQPRVLWDYVGAMLVPFTPGLGLIQDDVAPSRDLIEPWTTLPAIGAWLLVVAGSLWLLRREPLIPCGVLFFLGGHLMESTILPLELYFEHRNYLPSVGILIALIGIVAAIGRRLPAPSPTFRRLGPILLLAYLGIMWFGLHGRAQVWSDAELLAAQAELYRPNALRTQTLLLGRALAWDDHDEALRLLDRYDELSTMGDRATTNLWRLQIACASGKPTRDEIWSETERLLPARPGPFALKAAIGLAERVEAGDCADGMNQRLRDLYRRWVERLDLPPTAHAAWRLRFLIARLAASDEDWQEAVDLATRAWEDSGWNSGVGVLVVQLAHTIGDARFAVEALDRLAATAPRWDLKLAEAIEQFRAYQAEEAAQPATGAGTRRTPG